MKNYSDNNDEDDQSFIQLSTIISNENDNENLEITNSKIVAKDSLISKNIDLIVKQDENNDTINLEDININIDNNQDVDVDVDLVKEKEKENNKVPAFAYIILAIALFAMSSSGTVLKIIDVPPLLKASWRLQSTSVLLFFGFIYEIIIIYDYHIKIIKKIPMEIINKLPTFLKNKYNNLLNFKQLDDESQNQQQQQQDTNNINQNNNNNNYNSDSLSEFNKEEIKLKLFQTKTILLLLSTGFILSIHFALWITSLDETTLSHSLLFVTSSPLMVVIVMLIRRIPISKGEIIGCILGFIGLIVTLFDSLFLNNDNDNGNSNSTSLVNSSENQTKGQNPTFYGDILALLGAVCIVFYLFAGSHLRKWMPIFCYAFIVTFSAAIFLTFGSLIFEDRQGNNLIGWLSSSFILATLYIAFAPGFLGHTGMNYIVKFIEPVVISVTLLLEPAIGTIMGFAFGVAGELPSLYTYLGGALILGGCTICSVSSHFKNKNKIN